MSESGAAPSNAIDGTIDRQYGSPLGVINQGLFNRTQSTALFDQLSYGYTDAVLTRGGTVQARAENGSVGVAVSASYANFSQQSLSGDAYNAMRAASSATSTIDDIRITGPGSGNVSTRLRVHLEGVLTTTSIATTVEPAGVIGDVKISLIIYLNGIYFDGGNYQIQQINGEPFVYKSGMLSNFDGDDVLTTAAFSAPLNTPITIGLQMSVIANATVQDTAAGIASGSGSYYNTLTFATDRPVFQLPAGYTANSLSAGIVNNSFTVVPEPGTAVLVLLAAPAVLLRRRR